MRSPRISARTLFRSDARPHGPRARAESGLGGGRLLDRGRPRAAPAIRTAPGTPRIAGWVRARLAGGRSATLRADLDKLVLEGIIPDRVRAAGSENGAQAESDLRAEWAVVKERWK